MSSRIIFVLIVTGIAALIGGCATTEESEIPWNQPQQWEGQPNIPGIPSYQQ